MTDKPKGSPTGRAPSQPDMQSLRPPMTPEQHAMVDTIRDGLRDYQKPLYDAFMAGKVKTEALNKLYRSAAWAMAGCDFGTGDQTALAIIAPNGDIRELLRLDDLKTITARKKEDREKIARVLVCLAQSHDAQCERIDDRSSITLVFSLAGVGAMIDIDTVQGDQASMISWHNIRHPARNFTPRFCKLVGAGMFAGRHHKASSLPADWYSLAMMLDAGLLLAARSEAFDQD